MSAGTPGSAGRARALGALLLPPLLWLLLAAHARACNNMELKGIQLRSCSKTSAMRGYDVRGTLTKDCRVTFRACWNTSRLVESCKINYHIYKPPVNKNGVLDWCEQAEELCAEEEKKTGVSCAASRNGGGGGGGGGRAGGGGGKRNQRNNNKQQAQRRNKYASMTCPLRPGRRCIRDEIDVKDIKNFRQHVIGTYKVTATVDHGDAGSSCINGTFTLGDATKSG